MTNPAVTRLFVAAALLCSFSCSWERETAEVSERVVLESHGWRLIGDWRAPAGRGPVPAALLLHRAAGSRREYASLAEALVIRGVASLRLDLRGHGDSSNLGRFEPPYAETRAVLADTRDDVNVALRWIATRSRVDAKRIAVVGASYSGEAIGEALRQSGEEVAAHVLLSPGSFSRESIALVDAGETPWLFIRTSDESEDSVEFIDAVFEALATDSETAEIRVLRGAGHATEIFGTHPAVVEQIADWLAGRLR